MRLQSILRGKYTLDSSRIPMISGGNGWLEPFIDREVSAPSEVPSRIIGGELRVFSKTLKLKQNEMPDWHLDFVNNYLFEKNRSDKVRINELRRGDCLFPCELSRLQFLLPMVLPYGSEPESPEKEAFVKRTIESWTEENPTGYGIHWRMHMESAIRSLVLVTILPFVSGETAQQIFSLALECINHVARERILHPPAKRHNHYLIELVCTLIVSDVIKNRTLSRARRKAFPAIAEEIERQFHKDGVNFECSVSYHRLTVEALLLLYSYLTRTTPEDPGSTALVNSLETLLPGALGFIEDYSSCLGRSPQYGDSSDGRILFCEDYYTWNPLDSSYLFKAAAKLGISPASRGKKHNLIVYPESGYAFLFGENMCASACNSVISEEASGHSHLDKLSWTLAVNGKQVFMDPGTWMYNSDLSLRRDFKSTGSHNTVMIDNEEQAITGFTRAFFPITGISGSISRFESGTGNTAIEMTHTGYSRLKGLGTVTRRIEMARNEITVQDFLEGSSPHSVSLGYLIHPDVLEIAVTEGEFKLFFEGFSLRVQAPVFMDLKVEEKWYSSSYGEKTRASRIVMSGKLYFPAAVTHRIFYSKVI